MDISGDSPGVIEFEAMISQTRLLYTISKVNKMLDKILLTMLVLEGKRKEAMIHQHQIKIEKPCCAPGTMDCGCMGRDALVCVAEGCPGIQNEEPEKLFEDIV